jgi:hypothetical protein
MINNAAHPEGMVASPYAGHIGFRDFVIERQSRLDQAAQMR